MGMGQHKADQIFPMFLDEHRIRHDDIDTGRCPVIEGDAAIDHQPLAGMAVEIEVHADFTGAAERQEQNLVVAGNAGRRETAHFGPRLR